MENYTTTLHNHRLKQGSVSISSLVVNEIKKKNRNKIKVHKKRKEKHFQQRQIFNFSL